MSNEPPSRAEQATEGNDVARERERTAAAAAQRAAVCLWLRTQCGLSSQRAANAARTEPANCARFASLSHSRLFDSFGSALFGSVRFGSKSARSFAAAVVLSFFRPACPPPASLCVGVSAHSHTTRCEVK